jgi:sugar lactone lactonase YvrE
VDAEGYIWSAQWAASRVVRYSPKGEIDFILPLPVSQPTCAAFGGPDLNMLFITTAYQGMTPEARKAEPEAGNLFIFQTDIKGIADPVFMPELLPFSES